jgi:indoleacetamide hydrolase
VHRLARVAAILPRLDPSTIGFARLPSLPHRTPGLFQTRLGSLTAGLDSFTVGQGQFRVGLPRYANGVWADGEQWRLGVPPLPALYELGVADAARAIRTGEITAERLGDALLARAAVHANLTAFITLDADRVREAAREADRQRASGAALGPLHGVPLALKDNLDTADLPTTGGTPGLAAHRPKRNAAIVDKLLGAGAITLGKTNLHELAYGITNNNAAHGPAHNPYAPDRIPGASSGGTGVAVAARIAPGGIGSDTGGSVRIPAALCGIVGFRPTTGRWSQVGIVPISHTRDTAGPMTRSVADCALLDGVVTGAPTAVAPARLQGMRIGLPRRHFWENLDAELENICQAALVRLSDGGATLVDVDMSEEASIDAEAGFPIALYETVTDLNKYLAEHQTGLDFAALVAKVASPDVKGILQSLIGEGAVPEPAYRKALQRRSALQEAYARHFRDQGIAAIIFPTTPAPAAKIGEDETFLLNGKPAPTFPTFIRNTGPGSVAGIPGISLPVGMTAAGLPIGMELSGPHGSDHELLAIAAAVERLLPRLPAPAG